MPRTPPWYGWYGDDFTGATDTLATLARAGQRALLMLGIPDTGRLAALGELDALGIAGAARSMDPQAMRAELEPVGRFFAGLGVRVMHYKCCSTFDSAPHVGSIGAAVAVLRPFFPNPFLPIVGGQPNIGRYCLFSTLFAAAGTGGAVHRLDRHPTMSAHPVTPMAEADLRLHLAAQGLSGMAGLHYPDYGMDDAALDGRLDTLTRTGEGCVLLDVAGQEHLAPVGRLLAQRARRAPLLAVGPSSVAQALTLHQDASGAPAAPVAETMPEPARGPVFVMAGSLSPVTRRQIEAAASFERLRCDAGRLCGDPAYVGRLIDDVAVRLRAGRHVLVWTAPDDGVFDATRVGAVADASGAFVAAVVRKVPVGRLGILGGDTSSKAVAALGCWGLSHLGTLAPGVTLCRSHGDLAGSDGLEVMLKGGQMGPDAILERLIRG